MKYYNDNDRFVITREQYDHLPSALHKLTIEILISRGELVLKGAGIADLKQTSSPETNR